MSLKLLRLSVASHHSVAVSDGQIFSGFSQVLANTLAELENPSDGYLQRHSWLAGELCGDT